MKATSKPFLFKERVKNNGKFPVKIKVIFKRDKRFFEIGIDMTEKEFAEYHINKKLKSYFDEILFYQKKAENIITNLKDRFSFSAFRDQFYKSANDDTEDKPVTNDFFDFSLLHINSLEKEGRIKFALSFRNSHSYLLKYVVKNRLSFTEINSAFLKELHNNMQSNSLSTSTIGIYMRNIRRLFNLAISEKVVAQEFYPFGRNKYSPPTSKKAKKALSIGDIGRIFSYIPQSEMEFWARDMWMFAYFANGINVKDIALLKYENIGTDEIQFIRAKTSNATQESKTISIVLVNELKQIIAKWGRKDAKGDDYIFEIISYKNPTPVEIYKGVASATKLINKYIGIISNKIGIERRPTTNFARHSYATVLKRAGVSIEMISEQLGHTSVKTTEIYLGSFEKEQRQETIKHLTAFTLPKKKVKKVQTA